VPRGQGLVITRAGRGSRTRAQGLALVVPLLDRVERLGTGPAPVQPLVARARTADGLPVVVCASAMVSVVDLSRVAAVAPDVHGYAADVAEQALADAVAELELAAVSATDAAALRARVLERVAVPLAQAGLRADSLTVEGAEVTVARALLSWADARARDEHARLP
jgi:hypothetical protein